MHINLIKSITISAILLTAFSGCSKQNSEDNLVSDSKESKIAYIYVVDEEGSHQHEVGYRDTLTVETLLEGLSTALSCDIQTNKITQDKNSISIDFLNTSAPFHETNEAMAYYVLDSIRETLIKNFGEELQIYYSVESNDTELKFPGKTVTFPADLPYMGSSYYEETQ